MVCHRQRGCFLSGKPDEALLVDANPWRFIDIDLNIACDKAVSVLPGGIKLQWASYRLLRKLQADHGPGWTIRES